MKSLRSILVAAIAALCMATTTARADYAYALSGGSIQLEYTSTGGTISVTRGDADLPPPTFVGMSSIATIVESNNPQSTGDVDNASLRLVLGDISVEVRPNGVVNSGSISGKSSAKSFSFTFNNTSTTSDATINISGQYAYQLETIADGNASATATFEAAIEGTGLDAIGPFAIGPKTDRKRDSANFATGVFVPRGTSKTIRIVGTITVNATVVPEPSSLVLLGLGLVPIAAFRLRRRRA